MRVDAQRCVILVRVALLKVALLRVALLRVARLKVALLRVALLRIVTCGDMKERRESKKSNGALTLSGAMEEKADQTQKCGQPAGCPTFSP
jgi:DNA-binding transcriptional regulator PaaX